MQDFLRWTTFRGMVRREGDRPSRRTEDNGGGRRHSRGQHPSGDKRRAARDRRRSSPDKPSGEADLYYDSPSPQRRGRDTGGNDREDRLGQGRHGKVRPKRVSASPAPLVPNSDRSSGASSNLLSADSLARLNALNEKTTFIEKEGVRKVSGAAAAQPGRTTTRKHHQHDKRKRRVVSGPALEEGRARRYDGPKGRMNMTRKRQLLIAIILVALLLVIFIPVGVLVIGKKKDGDGAGAAGDARGDGPPANANLATISESDIPAEAKGTILDPFAWYDTGDFNVTYTAATVGDLPVMGLNSTWDDHTRANDRVPYLDEEWQYGTQPIRGVNVGGWLNVEPFITPSLFRGYGRHLGVVDEYTLTKHLGPTTAAEVLERHYATFVTESTFAEIAAAGLDHVRIPFGYWAVATFADDPYVPQISWRYLLRAIEWARRYGLRVNLDLHGAPGSQNGWNHSGRLGTIGWMNGTDGALNAQRTLEIHDRMSKFFGQDRYRNVVAVYGLLNEPKMSELPQQDMRRWNEQAIRTVRSNGVDAIVAIGDGFLGLPKWKGQLTAYAAQNEVVLDAHQYLIFNADQLAFTHQRKLEFICDGWAGAMRQSVDRSTGLVFFLEPLLPPFCSPPPPPPPSLGSRSRLTSTIPLPSKPNPVC